MNGHAPRRHRTHVLFVRLSDKEHAELTAAALPHSWTPLGVWARDVVLAAARKLPKKRPAPAAAALGRSSKASHFRARARLATSPAARLATARSGAKR